MSKQPSTLELAKNGNFKAIAVLINRQLRPQGITAKVSLKEKILQVILEASEIPDKESLSNFIYKGIKKLKSNGVERLTIYGKVSDQEGFIWSSHYLVTQEDLAINVSNLDHSNNQDIVSDVSAEVSNYNRSPKNHSLSDKDYEKIIYDQTSLKASIGAFNQAGEAKISSLSKNLKLILSNGEQLLEVIFVRHKGKKSYLIFTDCGLTCVSDEELTKGLFFIPKEFSHEISSIRDLCMGNNGLSWIYGKNKFRIYFEAAIPNNTVLTRFQIRNVAKIEKDSFEQKYEQDAKLGCGILVVLAILCMWGFSSCVGAMFKSQDPIQETAQVPTTQVPIPQASPSSQSTESSPSTSSRTFLGEGPTGYTLWLDSDGCVYVQNLRESDLARLNVSIGEFKQVIKEETGSRCVFFE